MNHDKGLPSTAYHRSTLADIELDINNLTLHDPDDFENPLNITYLLNETLCVRNLLRSINLEHYADRFENFNLDLEQFLNLKFKDLEDMGVQSPQHCKLILELIDAFALDNE